MNLFNNAIQHSELLKFALGEEMYFIPDRDFGEHSVIRSWTEHIKPLIEEKGKPYVNEAINKMLVLILSDNTHFQDTLKSCLLYHLHACYYLHSENKIEAEVFSSLNSIINLSFEKHIMELNEKNDPKAFLNTIELVKSRGGLK